MIADWSTYSLSSFLLFAPGTYYRLFELYNQAVWPAQFAALAGGGAILWLAWRGGRWSGWAAAVLLASAWVSVAWAFHLARYQTINWAAEYFAWGFFAEAALLLGFGAAGLVRLRPRGETAARVGLALIVFALALMPLAGPALGRAWAGIEVFGLAPDPTVVATLGFLALARGRGAWLLWILPLAWCAVGALTLLAMKSPEAALMPAAAVVALAAVGLGRGRGPNATGAP